MVTSAQPEEALPFLLEGSVIAYPTEGVFGLGCDPFNKKAVLQLLALKERPLTKGLILLASNLQQVKQLIQPLTKDQIKKINAFLEPTTWVFPASQHAPSWITGSHSSIAIRFTQFSLARSLCNHFGNPLVSTSANPSGCSPARKVAEVIDYFGNQIAFILKGKVGSLNKPTSIRDLNTNQILRD